MADVLHLILQKSLQLHQNDMMESPALVHRNGRGDSPTD
jgi:hypothetical protein